MDMKNHTKMLLSGSKTIIGNKEKNIFKEIYKKIGIDFKFDLNKLVEKTWGWEYWIINCKFYCGKILKINKDYICSTHYHQKKHETFHILSGFLYLEYDINYKKRTAWKMTTGDTIIVPPFTKHAFGGITDAIFIEISTQHFENDSYRENKSRYVPNGSDEWYKNSSKYFNMNINENID